MAPRERIGSYNLDAPARNGPPHCLGIPKRRRPEPQNGRRATPTDFPAAGVGGRGFDTAADAILASARSLGSAVSPNPSPTLF